MCYPVVVSLEQKDDVLCEIVRWHYYDNACGEHSNNPERNGIDVLFIEKIMLVIEPWRFNRAKCEGLAWAEYELQTQEHYIDFEKVPREFILRSGGKDHEQ